ncbi:MAG: hypothetical protein VYA70_01560 [Gemmatimonadota bacterium]|nr:hypothetical protein [Gemmatimonadota bacterium]
MHDVDRLGDPATGLSSQWHFEIVLDFLFPIAHRGVTLTVTDMLESLRGALVAARSAGGDRVEISSEGWSV